MANAGAQPEKSKHRLKLKGSIGKGAFGEIFKGVLDGDVVAVKTISGALRSSGAVPAEGDAHMFFQEASMLRECSHKRIIGYKALMRMQSTQKGCTEPMWALVMEYAKHGNLGQRVVQNMIHPGRSTYSNTQALGWALDVAQALEYLHMRSPAVLHRDVKSANIMITDEDGSMVAKLSDFGLHVSADDSRVRSLQASSYLPAGIFGKGVNSAMPSVTVTADAPNGSSKTPDGSSHTTSSSSSGQQQQQQLAAMLSEADALPLQRRDNQPAAAAVNEHDMYSEVHDSCGSRVYVGTHSTLGTVPAKALQCSDSASTAPAAGGAAAASGSKKKPPARRNNSFRRASHHPPSKALPRVPPSGSSSFSTAAGAAALAGQLESAADANAHLFAHWMGTGSSTGGSMCSMVTEGTWGTQGTAGSCTDTAGSDCTDDTCGSVFEEVETVFNMTGRTGSCLYMAPEVYLAHSYNEKSDVFSYGVVLYELFTRCLIVFTELPTNSTDPDVPQRYATKVAEGYRPSRPKAMPDNIWALITACWQQDPLMRPHMSEVVAVLSAALSEEVAGQLNRRKSRLSISLGRKTPPPPASQVKGDSPMTQQGPSVEQRSSSPAAAAAPLATVTSGAQLSDGICGADVVTSSSADARPPASKLCAAASRTSSSKKQEKGGPDAVPAAQSCGCVIC